MSEQEKAVIFAEALRLAAIKFHESQQSTNPAEHISLFEKGIDLYYNENSSRDLINWRRARAVIEHENHLVNHRLTWMLTSQAGLFAAFGIMVNFLRVDNLEGAVLVPIYILILIGILLCFNTYMNLKNANEQLSRITRWWYSDAFAASDLEKSGSSDPGVNGASDFVKQKITALDLHHPPLHYSRKLEAILETSRKRKLARKFLVLARIESIPWYIVSVWVTLAIGVSMRQTEDWASIKLYISQNGAAIGLAFVIGMLICMIAVAITFKLVPRDDRD